MSVPPESLAVESRCPVCEGMLEAFRTQRYAPSGGHWKMLGKEAWAAKCVNGHEGVEETLSGAVRELARRHAGR